MAGERIWSTTFGMTLYADNHLGMALQVARMCTWDWNLSTGTLVGSTGFEALIGGPTCRSLNTFEQFLSFVHPVDRPSLESVIQQTLR